jgi:hypothetical protein
MVARQAIFAAVLLLACHQAPERLQRCASLDRLNSQALVALPDGEPRQRLHDAARCVETARGAWGLELTSLRSNSEGLLGRWSLVHIDGDGVRKSVAPDTGVRWGGGGPESLAPNQNLEWSTENHVFPTAPVLFDYDGDGEPEALVIVDTVESNEAGLSFHVRRGRVWTAASGALSLYPPAREFVVEDTRDVDGDGRPDLITHAPYAALAIIKCGSEDPYPVSGPALLGHAIPGGTFSFSDAVAASFARRECAASPRPVLVPQRDHPDMIDFAPSARNLACARLFGADPAGLTAEVANRCRQHDNCPSCDNPEILRLWAALPPPVQLNP